MKWPAMTVGRWHESRRGLCHRQTGTKAVIEFVLARTYKAQWLNINPTIEGTLKKIAVTQRCGYALFACPRMPGKSKLLRTIGRVSTLLRPIPVPRPIILRSAGWPWLGYYSTQQIVFVRLIIYLLTSYLYNYFTAFKTYNLYIYINFFRQQSLIFNLIIHLYINMYCW